MSKIWIRLRCRAGCIIQGVSFTGYCRRATSSSTWKEFGLTERTLAGIWLEGIVLLAGVDSEKVLELLGEVAITIDTLI